MLSDGKWKIENPIQSLTLAERSPLAERSFIVSLFLIQFFATNFTNNTPLEFSLTVCPKLFASSLQTSVNL